MILIIIPITLIGTASPFAIRLAIRIPPGRKVSGRIYAISTLGSFIGTFLPVLVLIPTIGTYHTFLVISGLLMIVALLGLYLVSGIKRLWWHLWMPIVIVLLFILGVRGTDKATPGLVYETESSYNYIQVIEQNGYTMLRLNDGQGIHSIYQPGQYNSMANGSGALCSLLQHRSVKLSDVTAVAIFGWLPAPPPRGGCCIPQCQIDASRRTRSSWSWRKYLT